MYELFDTGISVHIIYRIGTATRMFVGLGFLLLSPITTAVFFIAV